MVPIIRPEPSRFAGYEPDVMDMDVNAHPSGLPARLRCRGRQAGLQCRDRADRADRPGMAHRGGQRDARGTRDRQRRRRLGRRGCRLGRRCEDGLQPKRRTAAILPAPEGYDIHGWPVFGVAGEPGYFKPESGKLLVSPGDTTPVDPQDVQPEELDIAILVDWFETKTTQSVRRVERRWAGLRTFAPDNAPVLGEDPEAPGFWWLAGQGGYGIMMAESLGRGLAALMRHGELPADLPRPGRDACRCLARALSAGLKRPN